MTLTGYEPAMPIDGNHLEGGFNQPYAGLTIRQHFAAMAMHGLLANSAIVTGTKETITVHALTESAVYYADALIYELNK